MYVLLMVHSRWTEITWHPRDTIEVRAATQAHLTVACGVRQSIWCLCGEWTCSCGKCYRPAIDRSLFIKRSTNRYRSKLCLLVNKDQWNMCALLYS